MCTGVHDVLLVLLLLDLVRSSSRGPLQVLIRVISAYRAAPVAYNHIYYTLIRIHRVRSRTPDGAPRAAFAAAMCGRFTHPPPSEMARALLFAREKQARSW